jgi:molybdopterin biosynthesis enzyme
VSVGDFDPLHKALSHLEAERHFWRVKMKPGKPISVASLPRSPTTPSSLSSLPVFSLPGNPVSCVVGYLLFVHPLIQRASGVRHQDLGMTRVRCRLASAIEKRHSRAEFLRVRVSSVSLSDDEDQGRDTHAETTRQTPWLCELTGGQSSGWISSVASGDGLLWVPASPTSWPAGHIVDVSIFPWAQPLESSLYFSQTASHSVDS